MSPPFSLVPPVPAWRDAIQAAVEEGIYGADGWTDPWDSLWEAFFSAHPGHDGDPFEPPSPPPGLEQRFGISSVDSQDEDEDVASLDDDDQQDDESEGVNDAHQEGNHPLPSTASDTAQLRSANGDPSLVRDAEDNPYDFTPGESLPPTASPNAQGHAAHGVTSQGFEADSLTNFSASAQAQGGERAAAARGFGQDGAPSIPPGLASLFEGFSAPDPLAMASPPAPNDHARGPFGADSFESFWTDKFGDKNGQALGHIPFL